MHDVGDGIEFLQSYTLTLRHKAMVKNKATDDLNRRMFILTKMSTMVMTLRN